MTDSEIIWKFLTYEYTNNDTAIYLYVHGNIKTPQTSLSHVLNTAKQVFYPAMPEYIILSVVKAFLEDKKNKYIKGEIKLKPLY